jgi:hypothetical protein
MSRLKVLTMIIVKIPIREDNYSLNILTLAHVLTRQEKDNNQRVNNGEPMNLNVRHSQIDVPSGSPADGRRVPLHTVSEVELGASAGIHELLLWLILEWALPSLTTFDLHKRILAMVNTVSFNLETNDTESFTKKYGRDQKLI